MNFTEPVHVLEAQHGVKQWFIRAAQSGGRISAIAADFPDHMRLIVKCLGDFRFFLVAQILLSQQ